MTDNTETEAAKGAWSQILEATGSPLKLFALIVLVCNAVFGVSSAFMEGTQAFVFSLHTFLAVVAAFILLALWSPRSFYNPKELLEMRKLEQELGVSESIFPESRPLVPTIILVVGVLLYGLKHVIENLTK
jgi:hypothetical protein